MRGTSGPLQSWFPAVAACNPGTSCFQGSRLSQATELGSSQQDSRGGAWPVGHASDTPLRPLGVLHRLLRPLGRTCPAPDTPFASCLAPPPPRPSGSGRGGRPRPQHAPPPRPAPLQRQLPQQSASSMERPRLPDTPLRPARPASANISSFGLLHNAPQPSPDPCIQSLLHARMRPNLRGWQEKAAWNR